MAARTAQDVWIDDTARRAGYGDGTPRLPRRTGSRTIASVQIYRAATKELAVDTSRSVTTLPKELRATLLRRGLRLRRHRRRWSCSIRNDKQTIKGLFRLRRRK
jgi:hypothetical protein